MFRATIVRVDDSVVVDRADVLAQNAKRGTGDGVIWRGVFSIPPTNPRPRMGETLHLKLDDNSQISAVVTEVEATRIHFRARGRAPEYSPVREAVTESTQPCESGR
jgi:hypothetical protein